VRAPLEYFPERARWGEGAGATSPRIILEIRYTDRPAETRSLGPGRIIIGRESGDLVLNDSETSALHAEIEFTQGRVIVRDLGSRNGTWREGKRLPQFALFPGQRFICGSTEIYLKNIEGTDESLKPGGTAVGGQRPSVGAAQSSTTIARTEAGGPSAATLPGGEKLETVVSGGAPPPPGFAPVDRTNAGMQAPPAASKTLVAPVQELPPDAPPPEPVVQAAPAAAPIAAPVAVAAAASAPLGARQPVANAVIKAGDSLRKTKRADRPKGSGKRLMKLAAFGLLGAGALAALSFAVYSFLAGRNAAFVKTLAAEMPQDSIGILAVRSPSAVLELLGTDLPEELVTQTKEELGFDPFDGTSYAEMGVDMDAPIGITMLDRDGVFALSVGTSDKDKFRDSMRTKVAELAGLDEDLRWIERTFEDTQGMWLDEPIPAAALFPSGKRVILIAGADADAVARWAKEVAATPSGESLADRPGFEGLAKEKGKILAAAYLDGGSSRAALPGKGAELIAMRAAFADIDGAALTIIEDGPQFHLSWQTVVRDGAEVLETFDVETREAKALTRIGGPVLGSFDLKLNAGQIYKSISQMASLAGGMDPAERKFREDSSLDLKTDIFDNFSGEYGMALLNLPSEKGADDWGALAWFGVVDDDAAKKAAERFYAKTQAEYDLELEQHEGTTLYVSDGWFRVAFFVGDGHVWFVLGKPEGGEIVKPGAKSFIDEPRLPEIKKALAKGGVGAGFIDVKQLLAGLRPLLSEKEREREAELAPVLSPIELITFRSQLEGRAVVMRTTVHTSADQALPTLVRGVIEVAGAEFAKELARKRRLEKCDALIEHIVGLMRTELGDNIVADTETTMRREMLDECMSDDTSVAEIECMMAATSTDALTKCETVGDGATPVTAAESDPTPVPFVDDIWPNTQPAATAKGAPDPTVNYAIPTGETPAFRGPKNALVTIVMFGDFECPYCKRSLGTLDEVMAEHGEYTRIVFRNNPLPMHTTARIAARGALAAHRQGKFWPMHDKLFDNQRAIDEASIKTWAAEIGLDTAKFDLDFEDRYNETVIDVDINDAKSFGATGTPTFFVNGRYLGGTQPKHAFDKLIVEEKARAEKFVERRGNTRKGLYEDMTSHFATELGAAAGVPVTDMASEQVYSIDTLGLPQRGATGYAKISMVECGDFDCPFCARARTTIDELITEYPSMIVYWLHNPQPFHTGAEPAARAAVAAANQGKFWEMHDKLFEDKTLRSDADFVTMATDLGLDVTQFETDLNAEVTKELVASQAKICRDNDAKATPSFFINGRKLTGAQAKSVFKVTIDKEMGGGI
jgi:protein-disulfide isomerase